MRLSIASCLALIGALIFAGPAAPQAQRVPVPLDAMVREPAMSQMQLSPDGAHLAALTSLDGETRAISIWRTDALDQNPTRLGISGGAARNDVRFVQITWVSNDRLLVLMSQPLITGAGPEGRNYTYLARLVNLDGSRWIEPLASSGPQTQMEQYVDKLLTVSLVDQLPNDPTHILMSQWSMEGTSIYRVDVNTGAGDRVMRLADEQSIFPQADSHGQLRVLQFADIGSLSVGYNTRNADSDSWHQQAALTYAARTRRNLQVVGLDPENEDILIVLDNEGANYRYMRGYSMSHGAFTETMYQDPHHDISGVLYDRTPEGQPTRVIGFTYEGATETPYYSDPTYHAMYEQLRANLPGRDITIGTRKGRYRLVVAESSRRPPEYYLLTDDHGLRPLGISVTGIPSDQLADTQLINYTARDGTRIPAFLTLPFGWHAGDAPLPVIIQPHGGPWSRNDTSWGGGDIPVTQYFASRGFAVLQPQFRGSTGWGDALWRAGDGQWGLSMQDDNDDALQWLVDQHIGDPQRAIIYGFSYGGFAAMAATVRPHSPYRCAISGAGVSSLQHLGMLWRSSPIQRLLQGVTVGGMDPLEHAEDANIPILIYVGDRDQTAPIWNSQQFADALRDHHKPFQYQVIPDMAHGASTPAMRRQEFTLVESYIRDTCGIVF